MVRTWLTVLIGSLLCLLGQSLAQAQGVPNYSIQSRPLADVVQSESGTVALISTEVAKGTGFYVNSGGYVVTARHVIKLPDGPTAKNIRIQWTLPASNLGQGIVIGVGGTVVAEDPEHDLALLKPSQDPLHKPSVTDNRQEVTSPRYPAVLCMRTVSLRSGDPIFTIGHPFGDLRKITTTGIIASSEPNCIDSSGGLIGTYVVNMVINHGNSGGPVFASTGCVIGVADAIELTPVEAIGPDGKPLNTALKYSSGLGILIPQQYILKMLDDVGMPRQIH